MNNITICGRLSKDPEIKVVGDGIELCKFSVAVDRYQGKDKESATDFFDCSLFGKRGATVEKWMHKGDQITLMGEMVSNIVEKDGKKITYWNINVKDFSFGAKKAENGTQPTSAVAEESSLPDELPF